MACLLALFPLLYVRFICLSSDCYPILEGQENVRHDANEFQAIV